MSPVVLDSTLALLNLALLFLLTVTAFGIIFVRHLMGSAILLGIFSLLIATQYLVLDAPDVAITEAAVGAGLSTILLLSALIFCGTESRRTPLRKTVLPLAVVVITGSALVYATHDMPTFGSAHAPAQRHVAPYYLETSGETIGIPNVVTSILASYRGFDTLGETAVIFTAALSVLLLLQLPRGKKSCKASHTPEPEPPP